MNLNDIKPKARGKSDKFSWNLYRFLEKNYKKSTFHFYHIVDQEDYVNGEVVNKKVPFDINDAKTMDIWVGNEREDGLFMYGNRLWTITSGSKERFTEFANPWLRNKEYIDVTDEFIKAYLRIGRCLFTRHSNRWIEGDEARFTYINKNSRRCNWCGRYQTRRIKKIQTIKRSETWE